MRCSEDKLKKRMPIHVIQLVTSQRSKVLVVVVVVGVGVECPSIRAAQWLGEGQVILHGNRTSCIGRSRAMLDVEGILRNTNN